ncbi:hypothetical protein [Blastococcus sp. SYSU D00813]
MVALLAATLAVPLVDDRGLVATAGIVVAVAGLGVLVATRTRTSAGRRPVHTLVQIALHLSPVLLLTTIFPLVSPEITATRVGGVSLTSIVLASSMTVPWLSQSVCMPLYRGIGEHLHAGDRDALLASFCRVWPLVAVRALSIVAVFAIPVQLVMDWSFTALGAYLCLTILHLFFVQLLVISNTADRRPLWAAAWTAYAAILFLAPTWWFLPPVAGSLVLLVALRRHLRQFANPLHLDVRDVASDLLRGLLLGAVLWADKLLFFLTAGQDFDVSTVFLALLPAVLAYNMYFVVLAPRFDDDVRTMRAAMESEPLHRLGAHSSRLATTVAWTVARTGLAGAVIGFALTALVAAWQPDIAWLTASVSVASWGFMMTTVVSYKLDYIGQRLPAQVYGALHLAACVLAFTLLPAGAPVYLALAAFEAVLLVVALRTCLRHWRVPEYTLFWRHATSW